MKTIKISVTQDDIDKGIKNNCEKCPIARALARSFPGYFNLASIYYLSVKAHQKDFYVFMMDTPKVCYDFIRDFDQGKPVTPFEFEISY